MKPLLMIYIAKLPGLNMGTSAIIMIYMSDTMKLIIFLLAIFLIGLAVFASRGASLVSTCKNQGEIFFNRVRHSNFQQAYFLMSDGFRKNVAMSEFQVYKGIAALQDSRELKWKFWKFRGKIGLLKGSLVSNTGKELNLDLQLIKDGKTWKIKDFAINE